MPEEDQWLFHPLKRKRTTHSQYRLHYPVLSFDRSEFFVEPCRYPGGKSPRYILSFDCDVGSLAEDNKAHNRDVQFFWMVTRVCS